MQPDVGDDTGSARFHDDGARTGSFHLGDALLGWDVCCLDNNSFPSQKGLFSSFVQLSS